VIGVVDSMAINSKFSWWCQVPDTTGWGPRPEDTYWTILDVDSGLISNRVFDIAADDSSLWIATVSGLSQYVDDENRPMEDRWIDHSELGPNVVTSVIFAKRPGSHEVWMSEKLRDSVGVYLPGGIRVLGFPGYQHFTEETSGIPSNNCNEVTYHPTDDVFLSAFATRGAASVDVATRTWRYYNKTTGLVSDLASSIAVNYLGWVWPEGTIWYASQAGLSRIDPGGSVTNFVQGSGLPTLNVRKVYVAPGDQVWLSFVEGGAARISR
jgi:hypothetical protein